MPQEQPPRGQLTKFEIGPSVQVVMTVELLKLLNKAAAYTAANAGSAALETDEHHALYSFCGCARDTLKQEEEISPDEVRERPTYLFCL